MFAVWRGWLSLIAAMATALRFNMSQCTQAAQTRALQSNAANNTSRDVIISSWFHCTHLLIAISTDWRAMMAPAP
jgi:siroheme synthase (precorrin-2 oxidase/ferrochelatase)